MPALGESVTEGTVTRWLKAEGDTVEVDEPLLEVSTDKVDTEVPSPVAGTVQRILVGEDQTVPVGAELAVVGSGAASPTSSPDESGQSDDGGQTDESGQSEQGGQPAQQAEPAEPADSRPAAQDRPEAEPDEGEPVPAPPQPSTQSEQTPAPQPTQTEAAQPAPQSTPTAPSASAAPSGDALGDAATYVTPLVRKLALRARRRPGVGGRDGSGWADPQAGRAGRGHRTAPGRGGGAPGR